MSNDTPRARPESSSSASHRAASYRERLERRPFLLNETDDEDGEAPAEATPPDIEALQALVERVGQEGAAFQSVVVAAVQILERALCYEREAAAAALSLGQQEKLNTMVDTAEQAATLLRSTLNAQGGSKVMHLCAQGDAPTPADNQPWWFALTDALEVLEEGTSRMTSLTTAQPTGSAARELSQLIAQLLREHHDALLLEADEWIS
jgi:methionine synthase II (cobalamin-independent)